MDVTYATWNPSDKDDYIVLSNGDLTARGTSVGARSVRATIGLSSGKHYWEFLCTKVSLARWGIGTSESSLLNYPGAEVYSWGYHGANSGYYHTNSYNAVTSGAAPGNGDILMMALDMDNGNLWWGKNGTWYNLGNPATGANPTVTGITGTYFPMFGAGIVNEQPEVTANFGSSAFTYSVPSGFRAGVYSGEIEPLSITSFTPTTGSVGTSVTIVGTAFYSSPSVSFNGVSASVNSYTEEEIVTSVPSGATTGTISVTVTGNNVISADSFVVSSAILFNRTIPKYSVPFWAIPAWTLDSQTGDLTGVAVPGFYGHVLPAYSIPAGNTSPSIPFLALPNWKARSVYEDGVTIYGTLADLVADTNPVASGQVDSELNVLLTKVSGGLMDLFYQDLPYHFTLSAIISSTGTRQFKAKPMTDLSEVRHPIYANTYIIVSKGLAELNLHTYAVLGRELLLATHLPEIELGNVVRVSSNRRGVTEEKSQVLSETITGTVEEGGRSLLITEIRTAKYMELSRK